MAIKLRDEYGGKFPDELEELMKLDGVGRKTGNLFLSEVNGIPGIVVDTHVKRISYRLGFTKHQDPHKIEKDLNGITDTDAWTKLGHLVISFGRDICTARNPKCEICFLNSICEYYKEKQPEKKKASS